MDIHELEQETLKLDLDQRAQLPERLLLSLDPSTYGADMQVWIAESQRRLQEMRNGTVEEIPAAQVVQSMYDALE